MPRWDLRCLGWKYLWCNPLPPPKIPCQVILFLESLITMDTGERSMKGSCLVCCHVRSEFARHLEKNHALFEGGCQKHNKYQQVYLGQRKIKTTSTWKVLSQCGQAILPSCLALWLLLCCCSWYWETHIFPHLELFLKTIIQGQRAIIGIEGYKEHTISEITFHKQGRRAQDLYVALNVGLVLFCLMWPVWKFAQVWKIPNLAWHFSRRKQAYLSSELGI